MRAGLLRCQQRGLSDPSVGPAEDGREDHGRLRVVLVQVAAGRGQQRGFGIPAAGGDDDHGQWQRMASHLDHAMTKGAGSLRAAEIRTLTPHIEALARASDDLRASNEALLPIIRPLIDRDQATCKRLLETGVEGLIRFTIAEAMIGHQNRGTPGADGAWDDDVDRQIAPLIRASFDAADRQAAADAALWEAMRPLAERSPDDIEALNRVVTITCGARFKLVQLKIDQAKPGGGPS